MPPGRPRKASFCQQSGQPFSDWCTTCRGKSRQKCSGPTTVGTNTGKNGRVHATQNISYAENYMGRVEPGDFVIGLRKWDPVMPGGRVFQRSDSVFLAFVEDVRRAVAAEEFVTRDCRRSFRLQGQSASQVKVQRELSSSAYQDILTYII